MKESLDLAKLPKGCMEAAGSIVPMSLKVLAPKVLALQASAPDEPSLRTIMGEGTIMFRRVYKRALNCVPTNTNLDRACALVDIAVKFERLLNELIIEESPR